MTKSRTVLAMLVLPACCAVALPAAQIGVINSRIRAPATWSHVCREQRHLHTLLTRVRGGKADNALQSAVVSDDESAMSDRNDSDSSINAPAKTASEFLTRVVSSVIDTKNTSASNSSRSSALPQAVEKILEAEIREIAVASLNSDVEATVQNLRPALENALNATAEVKQDKATQWKPVEVELEGDREPSLSERMSPLLKVLWEWVPSMLFSAGSLCVLLAGIYYLEKKGINIGVDQSAATPSNLWERTLQWSGIRKTQPKTFFPVVYVVAGYVLSNWIALSARRSFSSFLMMDQTTSIFLQAVVKYAVLILAGNAVLKAMGYNIGLDNVVTGSSIAVGFASQSVLQNFAAGFGLLVFRPFKVGDRVCIKEHVGTVTRIQIYETMILTDDGRTLVFPNREISAQVMENYSAHGWRRVQFPFHTAASSDVYATRRAVLEVLKEYEHKYREYAKAHPSYAKPPAAPPTKPAVAVAGSEEVTEGREGLVRSPSNIAMLKDVLSKSGKSNGVLSKVLSHSQLTGGWALHTADMLQLALLLSLSEVLRVVEGEDVARHLRVLWDKEQQFAKPSPPALIMLGLGEGGYFWRVHVWCRASEHDGMFVTVAEAIARKLQDCSIKLASEVMERHPTDPLDPPDR